MDTQALGNTLIKSLISVREKKGAVHIEDVSLILKDMAGTLQHDASLASNFVQKEIFKIAEHILEAKREINELIPQDEESGLHINQASIQLDAVVKATEEATEIILDAADEIQSAVSNLGGGENEDRIMAASARIYEACNFQDLTGQRITKVVKTLEFVEGKVMALVNLFGQFPEGTEAMLKESVEKTKGKNSRKDEHLLNGPQLKTPSQKDIDALFASLK